MTLKLRFALLLGFVLGGFVLALLVVRYLESEQAEEVLQRDRQARAQLLAHWLDAASRALPQLAADLAEAPEFSAILNQPTPAATAKVRAALAGAGATWLWIHGEDGTAHFDLPATGSAPAGASPLAPADFVALVRETPNPRFFALQGDALVEICLRRRTGPGATSRLAWIAVARRWDDIHLRTLADLTESRVSIVAAHDVASAPPDPSRIELVRPLLDWRGRPLRVLRLDFAIPEIERALTANRRQSHVFIGFGLLLLATFGVALHGWVLRPLRAIEHSLGTQDPAPVAPLTAERSELGRVAGLVIASFDHRASLEREVAERARAQAALERSEASLRENFEARARLGRDLHDGVIQSLYAAGMGLAGIRMQLQPEQTEAAARLEQTRAALNETIHDVRNFIIGLEPEALKQQTFSHAIAALLDVMRGPNSFRSTLEIDENLASRLTLAQRVNALQIAREAVSNAVRHGGASHIRIELRLDRDYAEFSVTDDGRGFDPVAVPPGKGLGNFAERARELGGELTIDSHPGRGTRVRLTFSIPNL